MPRKRAPVKATGGGGFTFADKVSAAFLVHLLRRTSPLASTPGSVEGVHFETRESGYIFDDLLLELGTGISKSKLLASIKSERLLSSKGFKAEFVKDAWEQWEASGDAKLDREQDFLVLATDAIGDGVRSDWERLREECEQASPSRAIKRFTSKGHSSQSQREMFRSLRGRGRRSRGPLRTVRLASRIVVLPFVGGFESSYINECAGAISNGCHSEGRKLWSRLIKLAAEARSVGGYYDLKKLLASLRGDFELRDYPEYETDWQKLDHISRRNMGLVRHELGAGIELPRQKETDALLARLREDSVVAICGESGAGKSALLSRVAGASEYCKRIVWLTGAQLSKSSQEEVAGDLGLNHTVDELIKNPGASNFALVLDGFEKFEGEALRRAQELVVTVREAGFGPWKLIVTCETRSWGETVEALRLAGISPPKKTEFYPPSVRELYKALESVPDIRVLLSRKPLQRILQNLLIMDWVLRANVSARLSSDTRIFIGETEIIDIIWEYWVGNSPDRHVRDALLREIGAGEGQRLSGAMDVNKLGHHLLTPAGLLESKGLVRIDRYSIQFTQDLMGDWARYRVLISAHQNATETISGYAAIPRWERAIRLYAQSLVERSQGLGEWKAAMQRFGGDDSNSKLSADLFLDGILFAANAEVLLEQVWPDLIADEASLLHRMLKRLQYSATVPDPRFRSLLGSDIADELEPHVRLPLPVYWAPVLSVLGRHISETVKVARLSAARTCEKYLRSVPFTVPGTAESAALAVELARETQGLMAENFYYLGKQDRPVFESLLLAAKMLPNEVSQIALELSGRLPEPEDAKRRQVEAFEQQRREENKRTKETPRRNAPLVSLRSWAEEPPGPPDPDGPDREVPNEFRSSVMDTVALEPLIEARPEVAREILLAVCIDEPKSRPVEPRFLLHEELGLSDWHQGYPAAPWKGPFYRLLKSSPQTGLDAIVRLVNYATTRWLEPRLGPNADEAAKDRFTLKIDLGPTVIGWVGDQYVFTWNRSVRSQAAAVECALMALEKWLYEEVESGRKIDEWIQYIYSRGTSVAFAGVLMSLGLKFPNLFRGILLPLLGIRQLYAVQLSLSIQEATEIWRIGLMNRHEIEIKNAEAWHGMEHRKAHLQDVAPILMLQDNAVKQYLSQKLAEWRADAELHGDLDQGQVFFARFDMNNYSQTPNDDGTITIQMHLPADLEESSKAARDEIRLRGLALNFASSARSRLNEERAIPSHEVDTFVEQIKALTQYKPDQDDSTESYRRNSVAGGLAVLVVLNREWLSEHPEVEEWCMSSLEAIHESTNPTKLEPRSMFDTSEGSFLGEAGIALLCERSDEWVQRLAFGGITNFHYGSVRQIMLRAYVLRQRLGDRFLEILNVVAMWSALRHAADVDSPSRYTESECLSKYRKMLFRRFAEGELAGPSLSLARCEGIGRRLEDRNVLNSKLRWVKRHRIRRKEPVDNAVDRDIHRALPALDIEFLQNGFTFLDFAVAEGDASLWHWVEALFDLEMRTFPASAPGSAKRRNRLEYSGGPYGFDTWILSLAAKLMSKINSVERARHFFGPVLRLGPPGQPWIQDFLEGWTQQGIAVTADAVGFAAIWTEMVNFAMGLPSWAPGNGAYWSPAESLAPYLIGVNSSTTPSLGQKKNRLVIERMASTFQAWAQKWLGHASAAGHYIEFVVIDSGSSLLTPTVEAVANVVEAFSDDDWNRYGLTSSVVRMLSVCWDRHQSEVESQPDLRAAFLKLLGILSARQVPEALHLRQKIPLTSDRRH